MRRARRLPTRAGADPDRAHDRRRAEAARGAARGDDRALLPRAAARAVPSPPDRRRPVRAHALRPGRRSQPSRRRSWTLDALDAALHALARIAGELPAGEPLIADFYARTPAGRTRDELAAQLAGRVAAAGLPDNVLRVVIALCEPARGRGMSAVDVFTLRRDANGALTEDVPLRGAPPGDGRTAAAVAAGRVRARAPAVGRGRLPAARHRPLQPRRRAPVRCRRGARPHARARRRRAVVALPELERMLGEALEGIRRAQARRPAREKLLWNRVMLYVWPPIDVRPEEVGAVMARHARTTGGLGIEMVLVDGRLREPDGELRERVLRFFSPAGRGVVAEIDDPPARPLQPLDEGARRVVQARRRGTVHPSELVHLLPGRVRRARPRRRGPPRAGRAPARAATTPGSSPASHAPARTATPRACSASSLLGDPTKALGSLAEPECRRIIAALDLAEELGVPGRVVRAVGRRADRDGLRHREHGLDRRGPAPDHRVHAGTAARSTSSSPASTSARSRTGTPRRRCSCTRAASS